MGGWARAQGQALCSDFHTRIVIALAHLEEEARGAAGVGRRKAEAPPRRTRNGIERRAMGLCVCGLCLWSGVGG